MRHFSAIAKVEEKGSVSYYIEQTEAEWQCVRLTTDRMVRGSFHRK